MRPHAGTGGTMYVAYSPQRKVRGEKRNLRRTKTNARRRLRSGHRRANTMMEYPSKLIKRAVGEIAKLPGIGKKTALRLELHLAKEKEQSSHALAEALVAMRTGIKFCRKCFNI